MYDFILIGGLSAWYILIFKFCHKQANTFIPCAQIVQNEKLPENFESDNTCSKGIVYNKDNTIMWYSIPHRGLRAFIGDILSKLSRKERKEALKYLRRLKSIVHHTEKYNTIDVPNIINYFCRYISIAILDIMGVYEGPISWNQSILLSFSSCSKNVSYRLLAPLVWQNQKNLKKDFVNMYDWAKACKEWWTISNEKY